MIHRSVILALLGLIGLLAFASMGAGPLSAQQDVSGAPNALGQGIAGGTTPSDAPPEGANATRPASSPAPKPEGPDPADAGSSRTKTLMASLTIFVLAIFVGFEVITKVPPTLHTPLMSGSNAISGITIVGALWVAGTAAFGFSSLVGFVAVILATINVVGGFLVTHRMLAMFAKR